MVFLEYIQKNWRKWIKNYLPPIALDFYRNVRYASTSRQMAKTGTRSILPICSLNELFPGIGSRELSILTSQINIVDKMTIPLAECLSLAAICKFARPRRIFEIGTYMGAATLTMAMNTPSETKIFTLDLLPSARNTHRHGLGVGGFAPFEVGSFYQGTPFAKKICQLFANSTVFDYSSFYGTIDLIYIDGDHTYDFVKLDTGDAFKLLRPNGVIIWDDYVWNEQNPECAGVAQYLAELLESKSIFQIAGSRFAIYLGNNKK